MINKGKKQPKPKVLFILGPTSSGKTALAVKLAHKFNGEIISADSRQVYRGMDIGTGKDLKEYRFGKIVIPYHLIDVVSPKAKFNLAIYQRLAFKAIKSILQKGKLPIIVGGSGLYLQAVADNFNLPKRNFDKKIRAELEKLSLDELFSRIINLKPEFAKRLNNSDRNNSRRLVRYLEIILNGGEIGDTRRNNFFTSLVLGINISDEIMKDKIRARLLHRVGKENLVDEVKRLRTSGISYKRLESFGLEYKFVSYFLQNKLNLDEMIESLDIAIYRFAKRQKTWFNRWAKQGRKIHWIEEKAEAIEIINKFLKNPD